MPVHLNWKQKIAILGTTAASKMGMFSQGIANGLTHQQITNIGLNTATLNRQIACADFNAFRNALNQFDPVVTVDAVSLTQWNHYLRPGGAGIDNDVNWCFNHIPNGRVLLIRRHNSNQHQLKRIEYEDATNNVLILLWHR